MSSDELRYRCETAIAMLGDQLFWGNITQLEYDEKVYPWMMMSAKRPNMSLGKSVSIPGADKPVAQAAPKPEPVAYEIKPESEWSDFTRRTIADLSSKYERGEIEEAAFREMIWPMIMRPKPMN